MTNHPNHADKTGSLRSLAEEIARSDGAGPTAPLTSEEANRAVHELRVHQIELEMQNEELRRAQVELELSRARYFELYDLAPIGYLTLNQNGTILEVNLTVAELLHLERSAVVGKPLSQFVLSEDQEIFYRHRRKLLATGTPQACELRMLRREASPFWARLEATVVPCVSAGEAVVRVVVSDITDRRKAEETSKESRDALLKAHEDLSLAYAELDSRARRLRLLAGDLTLSENRERRRLSQVLHDGLQQHLLAAKLRTQILLEMAGADDLKQAIGEIEEIIAESVKISRSLSAELSPRSLYESGLAEGLEWLARWMRDKHFFTVELSIETRPALEEDVKLLVFESVRELLLNARKHAQISTARVDLALADETHLRITVSDNGAGFDPGRIKSPGDAEGGFGLFTVRERIGLIGGVFEIDSAPARGSRFTLVIPLPDAPPQAQPGGHDVAVAGGRREKADPDHGATIRVLVADDHTLFREGIARMLEARPDFTVVGLAADGLEAIELAGKLRPHAILMDIGLPRVNGIDATRVIHREHPQIHIIGLSMFDADERRQVMLDAGACDYHNKGCSVAELMSAIRGCVMRHRNRGGDRADLHGDSS